MPNSRRQRGAGKITTSEADLGKIGAGRWVCAAAVLAFAPVQGGEGLWSIGFKTQGIVDFEPGQDLATGLEIGYSDYHLFAHRLQFQAAYLTSRLEQAFRPNILRQDYFLFSPVWHFGRNSFLDPFLELEAGYWRYDIEYAAFDALDNDSWLVSVQAGLALNLFQGEYGLYWHFGYNFITPDSGYLYPGVFGIGVWKML